MGGHAEGGISGAHGLKKVVALINKPSDLAYLARQICHALDGPVD